MKSCVLLYEVAVPVASCFFVGLHKLHFIVDGLVVDLCQECVVICCVIYNTVK